LPYLGLSGARVFYETHPARNAPAATTFVLIHGWACCSADWDPVLPYLTQHGRVVTVDLRGCGRSSNATTEFHLPEVASDVLELLDHLDITAAVIIGHSAGAEVAVIVATTRPMVVQACVSVDPGYGFNAEDRERIRAVVDRMTQVPPSAVAAEYFARLEGKNTPPALAEAHVASAETENPVVVLGMFRDFAFGTASLHFRPNTDEFLSRPRPPLLAFYRNSERAAVGVEFATGEVDRVLVYDGSGHWLHQEQPERWVEDVTSWLGDVQVTR